MSAYYNEYDKFAADWLRENMKDGLVADGVVDDRSIVDVEPADLAGFTQVHLFAGIGVWSAACRLAGWSDDRPLWTASCPCPPFSSAGKVKACPECGGKTPLPCPVRTGFFLCVPCGHEWAADERHLWPEVWRLVRDCRPPALMGEQVASADGRTWVDIVHSSLEIMDYDPWSVDTCAAGFGAPHIRQRLYWLADTASVGHALGHEYPGDARGRQGQGAAIDGRGGPDRLADAGLARSEELIRRRVESSGSPAVGDVEWVAFTTGAGLQGFALRNAAGSRDEGAASERGREAGGLGDGDSRGQSELAQCDSGSDTGERSPSRGRDLVRSGEVRGLGDATGGRRGQEGHPGAEGERVADVPAGAGATAVGVADTESRGCREFRDALDAGRGGHVDGGGEDHRPGPTNGLWRDADWLGCTDQKWRPVEPGTFPLADAGAFRNRVPLLRGAGNAICLAQAAGFIAAVAPELGRRT